MPASARVLRTERLVPGAAPLFRRRRPAHGSRARALYRPTRCRADTPTADGPGLLLTSAQPSSELWQMSHPEVLVQRSRNLLASRIFRNAALDRDPHQLAHL